MASKGEVTELLRAVSEGDGAAMGELMPVVYDELRAIAHGRLRGERRGHTLSTTALVHEAYLKLVNLDRIHYQDRTHFFAIAAQAMRRVLVDYAVRRNAQKRGGGRRRVVLEEAHLMTEQQTVEVLALDAALKRLEALSERQHQIVECRFFAGLTIEETAAVLNVSSATVKRDWSLARAWLNRELREEERVRTGE